MPVLRFGRSGTDIIRMHWCSIQVGSILLMGITYDKRSKRHESDRCDRENEVYRKAR